MSFSSLKLALLVSLALHALFGMWVEVRDARATRHALLIPLRDAWRGSGIEVDAVAFSPAPVAASEPASTTPPVTAPARDRAAELAPRTRPEERHATRKAERTAKRAEAPATVAKAGARSDSPSVAAPAAPAGESGQTAAFGAEGLPDGVRHLPTAFARAMALADRGDARWASLPAGVVGEANVALGVSEDGELGELELGTGGLAERVAPVLEKLLENTRLLLARGRYSVSRARLTPGVMRVRVRVEIEEPGGAAPERDPGELFGLDFEAPRPGRPGHGAFLLNSGRRVIAWVDLD